MYGVVYRMTTSETKASRTFTLTNQDLLIPNMAKIFVHDSFSFCSGILDLFYHYIILRGEAPLPFKVIHCSRQHNRF